MPERDGTPLPDDPREWAPMRAYGGRRLFDIQDPVVEPLWSGTRVLAHVTVTPSDEPTACCALIEALGADLAPELPELAAAVVRAVRAPDAIVDGVITRQVALDGVGAAAIPEVRRNPVGMLVRPGLDVDVMHHGSQHEPSDGQPADGFVALDLLRVDGVLLLDVPLLERKRQLESVIEAGPLVRLSAHVRPPIDSWIATWKSVGLRGGILKAANSRYHPNQDTIEWRAVERLGGRR